LTDSDSQETCKVERTATMTSKIKIRLGSIALGASVFLMFAGVAVGQTVSGTLRGTVTDTNGAAVPNATVTARSMETGLERTATTSGEGSYNFAFLPIGRYRVEATRTDFNKVIQESV